VTTTSVSPSRFCLVDAVHTRYAWQLIILPKLVPAVPVDAHGRGVTPQVLGDRRREHATSVRLLRCGSERVAVGEPARARSGWHAPYLARSTDTRTDYQNDRAHCRVSVGEVTDVADGNEPGDPERFPITPAPDGALRHTLIDMSRRSHAGRVGDHAAPSTTRGTPIVSIPQPPDG